MVYDVIVVGAGMAGMTSAIYLARAGKSVLVLEAGVAGGQIVNTLKVENWPGDYGVSGAELMKKIYHQMNNLGAKLRYECVESVEVVRGGDGGFEVKTDEAKYACRAIILAVGTEPRRLSEAQLMSAGERPISYCATCDGALYKGRPVVVVGSGNTAKNEIKYLEGICEKVYHVHHTDPIPEEAEAVFVAIGRVPGTEKFRELVDLDEEGYVVAGEDGRTSRAGVFAAGDCRTKKRRQLATAAGDGANAAGAALDYLNSMV